MSKYIAASDMVVGTKLTVATKAIADLGPSDETNLTGFAQLHVRGSTDGFNAAHVLIQSQKFYIQHYN